MKILVILCLAGVAAFMAYTAAYPTTVYKFKITMEVETPSGGKTGASVIEIRNRRFPSWMTLGNRTGFPDVRGEAVVMNLGRNSDGREKNITALLRLGPRGEGGVYSLAEQAFARNLPNPSTFKDIAMLVSELPVGTRAILAGNLIPTLIAFSDLQNPGSARSVGPRDFEEFFGAGFSMKRIEIEIVPLDSPLSLNIEQKLPWWRQAGRPAGIALRAANLYLGEPELAFERN